MRKNLYRMLYLVLLLVVIGVMPLLGTVHVEAKAKQTYRAAVGEVVTMEQLVGEKNSLTSSVSGSAIQAKEKSKAQKSSKKNVAVVLADGTIWAKNIGNTMITGVVCGKRFQCRLKVENKGLRYSCFEMLTGESLSMWLSKTRVTKRVTSSSSKVVKIKAKGTLYARNKGTSIISVKKSGKRYRCQITVKKNPSKIIYLTFDDGPSLTTTPTILKILKKEKVAATFFTIGYDSSKEGLIRQMVKEGHTVAIHGNSHDYHAIYQSQKAYLANVYRQQKRIQDTTGLVSFIHRFPGGSSNGVSRFNKGIMTKLTKVIQKEGFTYFDWNISSGDASGKQTPEGAYKSVVNYLRPGQNNVVLMHDFSNNTATMRSLSRMIQYGKAKGYQFRAITESTVPVHHNILN